MFRHRTSVICTSIFLFCLVLLTACAGNGGSATVQPTPTVDTTPKHYTSHIYYQGSLRPDDLAFDSQGRVLFSDGYHGTVDRINADGSVTVLVKGLGRPEGIIMLADNTLIIAEQKTNRMLALAPGAQSPTVLRQLPGKPSSAPCKDGTNGIGFDQNTNTIIIPDSPTGEVYRMSLDGKTLTLLASDIARPNSATVDAKGNIYVDDECGGKLWKIAPNGATTHMDGFGRLDDVLFDPHGNLLVTDISPSIHALIRINLRTGKRETLVSDGFIKPEGLLVDGKDVIYLADDDMGKIVVYRPD